MKSTIPLLVLWACNALGEPLGLAMQKRSSRMGVYASDYARNYRKSSYVAIPLHEPLPVIHVLSSQPVFRPNREAERPDFYKHSHHSNNYAHQSTYYGTSKRPNVHNYHHHHQDHYETSRRPDQRNHHHSNVYSAEREADLTEHQPAIYAASKPHIYYARPTLVPARPTFVPSLPEEVESAPDIIYARPAPLVLGAVESASQILYARPNPSGGYVYSRRPNKKRAPAKPEPLIIRVHKHRIIRDR